MKRVLLGMLAPIKAPSYVDKSGCFSSDFNGWNIISSVTPMTKFFSGVSADSLTDIQLQCNIGVELEYRQCIASQLYYRGGIMDGSFNAAKAQKSLANTLGFVRWNDYPMDIVIGKADGSLAKDRIFKSSAITETFPSTPEYTLLHNSASTTIPVLTRLLDGVERKMSVGAYLHWYERYFSGKGDFSAAVGEAQETLSGVLDKYFDLCS